MNMYSRYYQIFELKGIVLDQNIINAALDAGIIVLSDLPLIDESWIPHLKAALF